MIDEFFDISFIISKLDEFDKLKMVILNDQQLTLFNFISKETICQNNNKLNAFTKYKSSLNNKIVNIENILNFKRSRNTSIKNEIDEKLFKYMQKI